MQHTLDHYIGNLLYAHECVVVPGFGAFLTRNYSAEINAATHMLRPPSKRVVFNARIQDNDGLLAQHIAKVEGKSYRAANEGIEIAARGWKKSLRAGRKVNLSGIGRLYIDDKGKLQFNPAHDVNYDIYSYGLNIFRANAMEREQEIKRNVNKAIEKHQNDTAKKGVKVSSSAPKATKINWVRWTATLGPVAALLVVGAYFYQQNPESLDDLGAKITTVFTNEDQPSDPSQLSETNESSIGFSTANRLNKNYGPEDDVISEQQEESKAEKPSEAAKEEKVSTEENKDLSPAQENLENAEEETPNMPNLSELAKDENFEIRQKPLYNVKQRPGSEGMNMDTEQSPDPWSPKTSTKEIEAQVLPKTATALPLKETKQEEAVKPIPVEAAKKPAVKMANSQEMGSIQIIVGAFSKLSNAERYTEDLQAKGWDAYIYKSGRLNRVAIGKLSNREKAQTLLTKVKQEVNYQAWINIQ